nr:MAG TPA: hypothetical protein [Caudoviricetes sp.]
MSIVNGDMQLNKRGLITNSCFSCSNGRLDYVLR